MLFFRVVALPMAGIVVVVLIVGVAVADNAIIWSLVLAHQH